VASNRVPNVRRRLCKTNSSGNARFVRTAACCGDLCIGFGLQNVCLRLAICYGPAASLDIYYDEAETRAELWIPAGSL
jgi:hypothetical protein